MCWCVVLPAADCPNEMLTRSLDVEQAGASSIELALLAYAFWYEDGFKYRSQHSLEGSHQNNLLGEACRHRVTWICALYFLAYVGAESMSSVPRHLRLC
jgi:hypothetical protein